MSFVAFKVYVGHRSIVLYVVQWLSTSTASDLCTLLLLTVCMRTVCVDAEQKNAKLNNWTWLNGLLTIGEHQNFLEDVYCWWSFCSMRSASPLSSFWHHVGILQEAAGSSRYFQVQYLQLNLYCKFGSEQPSSSVLPFCAIFWLILVVIDSHAYKCGFYGNVRTVQDFTCTQIEYHLVFQISVHITDFYKHLCIQCKNNMSHALIRLSGWKQPLCICTSYTKHVWLASL